MKFTEERLKLYAAPLSDTENEKCLHAIKEIRDALKDLGYYATTDSVVPMEAETYSYSTVLKRAYSNEEIQIFIQGSYANNTCVRGDSDVDIAIVRRDKYEYAFGKPFNPSSPDKKDEGKAFKDTVEIILRKHFPYAVTRKNKSIKVDGNTYRKQADTVPCFSIHYFGDWYDRNDQSHYEEGITIYADDGQVIFNFPKQHIANGKKKNDSTNYYYKKMVRIIKKMRYLMEDYYITSASGVSSFGLESLLWNLPNSIFTKYTTYRFAFDEIVDYLVKNKNSLGIYKEANGIKYLCPTASDVAKYSRFIDDLRAFYQYDI